LNQGVLTWLLAQFADPALVSAHLMIGSLKTQKTWQDNKKLSPARKWHNNRQLTLSFALQQVTFDSDC
jgi:hypothetical protein